MSALSVVVPAHDEEAVIGRVIEGLRDGGDDVEVIVVANGCSDRTAARAAARPAVRVIDIPAASKIAALNEGARAASARPVAYVDADVSVSGRDLAELARRLVASDRAEAASLTMRVEPSRSWWVRQYYRIWSLTDYRTSGHLGSGVYMLSAAGAERVGEFPDVIADDLYVQRLFAPSERLVAPDLDFSVQAPGSLRALVRRNTRIAAGNRQLVRMFPHLAAGTGDGGAAALARKALPRPALWFAFVVYCTVYLTAHRRARRLLDARVAVPWHRDTTTRVEVGGAQ